MRTLNIDTIRPIWTIDNENFILSKLGSYSKIFEIELPPVFSLSAEEYDRCLEDFNSIFRIIPDYVLVHKMDIYTQKTFDSEKINNPNSDFLKNSYKRKFNEKPMMEHKSYLVIAQSSKEIKKNTSLSSLIFKNNFIPKELKSDSIRYEFVKTIEKVISILNESKSFKLKELNKREIEVLCTQYETLNFTDSNFNADIVQDQTSTKIGMNFISALAINSLECLPNQFDNYYIDSNYSTDKTELKFSLFYPIGLGFKENHIVNTVFLKENKTDLKTDLRNIDNYNRTFIKQDDANPLNLEDSQNYSQSLEKGNFGVSYHANVLIWDYDKMNLQNKENKLLAQFNSIRFTPNAAWNEVLPLYWGCYPSNIADIGYSDQMFKLLDFQASALNIYETTRVNDGSEFGIYLSDRNSGAPLFVDISDLPKTKGLTNNRNKIIIGPSGSGKSFTTNTLVNGYLDYNTHIVIIDVGDSYQRLCQLRGGTYLTYNEKEPISFNPFHININDINIEKKESLITLIFTLWKKNALDKTKDEDAIIRDGLNLYYEYIEETKSEMCFNTYYDFMVNHFFPKFKNTDESKLIDIVSFGNVLKKFNRGGEYDYLLNSNTNIDLINQRLIVFELDNIKDHAVLFPIVTLMIMDTFITKMRLLKNTRKVLLLEEAWKAVMNDGMAEFLVYLFKTVRKHFGEAWLVTQELNDILKNQIVKETVIKNCGAKILLDMREYANNFDEIQDALGLTNKAKELILSMNKNNLPGDKYKEVFIGLGNEGTVYGNNVSREEYATYTTEKPEKEAIETLINRFGDVETAISIYANN